MTDNSINSDNKTESNETTAGTCGYHPPRLVNLGEIHSLVMSTGIGNGDGAVACTAS